MPTDVLRGLTRGDRLPDFSLSTPSGEELKSATYHGRTLVLVYLSAEQRNSELAAIDAARVARRHAEHSVELLLVTADEGHGEYFARLLEENHVEATLGYDTNHELYGALGLIVFPATLVVGADGALDQVLLTRRSDYAHLLDAFVGHATGQLDSDELARRLVAPTMARSSPKTMAQRHREAARLLRASELHDDAERELLTGMQLDPESAPIRLDLADLYLHATRYAEAEPLLAAILEQDADHRGALLLLGVSRFRQGELSEAEEILEAALHMNPDPERVHYYLGRIFEARGDSARALEHYRGALDRLLED